MKFVLLSKEFYEKYNGYREILQKKDRPYCVILLKLDDINIAIPLRSHIKHRYAFLTNKEMRAGLDYTKAVIVNLDSDIDKTRRAFIRSDEYKELLGKEYLIKKGFLRFLKKYKRALIKPDLPENKYLVEASSLQYFKEEIVHIK